MTVPAYPEKLDGICYYIWTDIFFGDMSLGRMNQFVPQLILGNALDGSSGAPDFKPKWGEHKTYSFGAHYFFETFNETSNSTVGHAAYGEMCPLQGTPTHAVLRCAGSNFLCTFWHLGGAGTRRKRAS